MEEVFKLASEEFNLSEQEIEEIYLKVDDLLYKIPLK